MKGFTLIELLAVIVILAIILMIATPMVMNVINSAKQSAAESSAKMFIRQVEQQLIMADYIDGQTLTINPTTFVLDLSTVKMSELPNAANTAIEVENGEINGTVAYQGFIFTVVDGTIDPDATPGTYKEA